MFFRIFLAFLLLLIPGLGSGQPPPDMAAPENNAVAEPNKAEVPVPSSSKDWRNTSGYPFPALADTVAAVQNMTQATILRDYCANKKLPDDFVRGRLALFSRITGRKEDCQSILGYIR